MKALPRTSVTDPLRIDEVRVHSEAGMIGVTFCPGKCGDSVLGRPWERDLAADLDVIACWGAQAVLTLLELHEMAELGVSDLGERIAERGIAWHHLPIVDLSEPGAEFERRWLSAGLAARKLLQEGRNVLVHCRGGRGRAGTVAACLMIELGISPREAIRKVRAARHGAIETSGQERYVSRYAARFGSPLHGNPRTDAH
jgi:protein-tyrosine phosphatase